MDLLRGKLLDLMLLGVLLHKPLENDLQFFGCLNESVLAPAADADQRGEILQRRGHRHSQLDPDIQIPAGGGINGEKQGVRRAFEGKAEMPGVKTRFSEAESIPCFVQDDLIRPSYPVFIRNCQADQGQGDDGRTPWRGLLVVNDDHTIVILMEARGKFQNKRLAIHS